MNRRNFITALGLGAFGIGLSTKGWAIDMLGSKKDKKAFPFTLTDKEWKERLTDQQYYVLRNHGTERAFTSELNNEKRNGTFLCSGCDHELFSSAHKYDSGTGWPSFYQPVNDQAIGESKDYKLFIPRVEVHCANCGGHQGHVFEDGPQPTGLRYCINGVAMKFMPA